MNKTIIIILSIILPGSGLWLLNQRKFAVAISLLVFLPLLLSFVLPGGILVETFRFMAVIGWVYQLYTTIDHIKTRQTREYKQLSKIKQKTKHSKIQNLPRNERILQSVYQEAKPYLKVGEKIKAAVRGIYEPERPDGISIQSPFIFCNLILTDRDLMIRKMDFVGALASIDRTPLSNIRDIKYSNGLINDKLKIRYIDKKDLVVKVSGKFRPETIKFDLS